MLAADLCRILGPHAAGHTECPASNAGIQDVTSSDRMRVA